MLKRKLLSALRIIQLVEKRQVTTRTIATELNVAVSYVEQLCSVLAGSLGILEGRRGPGGGYVIASDLEDVSMEQMFIAFYGRDPMLRIPISVATGLKLLGEVPVMASTLGAVHAEAVTGEP